MNMKEKLCFILGTFGSRDADGVHPNSKGHKIMTQKLFEFINSGLNL